MKKKKMLIIRIFFVCFIVCTTLQTNDTCYLSDPAFLDAHHRPEKDDYFFDRDHVVFEAVLNYLRTKELHLPPNVCSSAARKELEFWGIGAQTTERCCWTKFNKLHTNLFIKSPKCCDKNGNVTVNQTWWAKNRPEVWKILNQSQSSMAARIYGVLSFIMALMSLFSFIAATTEPFKKTEKSGVSRTNAASINSSKGGQLSNKDSNYNEELDSEDAILNFMAKHVALNIIDVICLLYFTVEYIVRLTFAPKKLRYVRSILAIIDLLAILPDYLDIIMMADKPGMETKMADFSYGMVVRVLRTLKIFRLVRHNAGLWVLIHTIRASIRELSLLVWFLGLGVLVFSSLIYFAESREPFGSIPACFWWALITMTTVGYGDFYPITFLGKIVGSLCAMCGVLLIGFTVPTLVNNFIIIYGQMKALKHFEERLEKPSDISTEAEPAKKS